MNKFFYWNLNYKEKFYRTFINIPFIILLSIILYLGDVNTYVNIIITSMNFTLFIFQLAYNYRKSK